jgi:hypothetical protein
MPPTDAIREALLEARASCVDAIEKVDAALKKMDVVEGLRIVPKHGRLNGAILAYMKMQSSASPAKTQIEASPKEVHEALVAAGWDVNAPAVHQAMHRMGKRGVLYAFGGGLYVLAKQNGEQPSVGAEPEQPPKLPAIGQRWVDKLDPEREVVLLRWSGSCGGFRCAVYQNKLLQKKKILISINLFGSSPTGYTYVAENVSM